ncbi:MAG: L28 family ribosomal protein [Candidatus Woesebacteria bacterium]|nr:L28 family ribosomal protein [Candidatus Woesebacteria bacterium]
MSYSCENCFKKTSFGSSQTHGRGIAGKRWKKRAQETKRTFKPNLQMYHGMKLCATCIKKLKNTKS